MKKLLLVTAIGSALSLVGCGSGEDAPESVKTEYQVAATRAVFDPSNGQVPVPSNILLGVLSTVHSIFQWQTQRTVVTRKLQ